MLFAKIFKLEQLVNERLTKKRIETDHLQFYDRQCTNRRNDSIVKLFISDLSSGEQLEVSCVVTIKKNLLRSRDRG